MASSRASASFGCALKCLSWLDACEVIPEWCQCHGEIISGAIIAKGHSRGLRCFVLKSVLRMGCRASLSFTLSARAGEDSGVRPWCLDPRERSSKRGKTRRLLAMLRAKRWPARCSQERDGNCLRR